MADGMEVAPEDTRAEAPKFERNADKLDRAFQALDQALKAEGTCWGADDPGKAFEEKYLESEKQAREGFHFLIENLKATTAELKATAETWESIDQAAAENLNDAGSWT